MLNLGLDILGLARFQFGMTTVFHFFFVPFSIGLAFVVAVMETMYAIKGDKDYKKMAQFWGKMFLYSFAVGVVTGIIQEFQFGMNWSEYSRFMGDIFGAPLAIEALAAFFLESTFIGMWMFTWDRFNKWVHTLFIWLVMFGSSLSALWILAANSFMQNPLGYIINQKTGHVQMVSFGKVVGNPQLWNEFPHVIFGAFVTAAFVIAGCSAWRLLKKDHVTFYRKSLNVALVIGLIFSLGSIASGDLQTRYLINNQPMKFAAMEGLYKNSTNKGEWAAVSGFDTKQHKTTWSVDVPYVLNLLSFHKTTGTVKGMNQVNKDMHAKYDKKFGSDMNYYVPTKTLFWSFRIMAGAGALFALLAIVGLIFNRKRSQLIMKQRWFLYILGLCLWLPFVVNTAGWFVTEFGRYPWIVYGLLTIADAVSPNVSVASLLTTNIVYFAMFAIMGLIMIILCHRTLKAGPDAENTDGYSAGDTKELDPYSKGAFNHD
ncbi:cytochrome ubiquinol oxidase subunit I [Levilactobacillus tujiorum]|uniref:Cytochrome ubiquinol oxidase subunit I n=1 Tax=Levilactobacillus tujiorum TaxID=2912243 RepID=A0ABX1L378_9LACO|nr:cytochrome ubiquinol oxidase subunit I [Levilactobacillus tujiorum]MCH5463845.1 cytochrome ubiquinol oxidase subunit I [Levilactobacillus tujiorum]NLR11053.1 cytochrome ubiquinol oxidase subunit I [Lactobacillus sp. HBUAS51387]NLR28749.1 cytochrome ubiquinol oxidase subunit I [Levilactobacillus tujiorum]NLR32854.1 cytochrome ubiquinol oxidase subunit I [Levilactobacillus tujiorum]